MSIVFGPTLFSAESQDPMKMLEDSRFLCDLLSKMINNSDKIVARTSSTGFSKLKDKTVNASMLFTKQQMVTTMAEMEDLETDEELLEELKEIEELLVDDLELVSKEELEAHREDFDTLPEVPPSEPELPTVIAVQPTPSYRSVPNKPLPSAPSGGVPPKPLGAPPRPGVPPKPLETSNSDTKLPPMPHKPPPRPPRNPQPANVHSSPN